MDVHSGAFRSIPVSKRTHNLLSDSQFGFRKNRSTSLQLLTLMEDWTDAFDYNLQVDTVYLDFKKMFDSVPHKTLLRDWLRNLKGMV